eukprot:TRINITY_DN16751_c0_g1_i1.p1 TRINITY_DN16751_c0_g1~~TRINITY_DN16751_c0_g1_i1.p1  ORF type:complete len:481 (+),score=65.18 TRINITY_DN16751_c0_g1_i1:24-1445(+)
MAPIHVPFVVVFAFLFSSVTAKYADGLLVVGEQAEFQGQAPGYDVFLLPYGITYEAAVATGGRVALLLDHVVCPDGSGCDYSLQESVVLELDPSDGFRITSKKPLPELWQVDSAAAAVTGPTGAPILPAIANRTLLLVDVIAGNRVTATLANPQAIVIASNPAAALGAAAIFVFGNQSTAGANVTAHAFDQIGTVIAAAAPSLGIGPGFPTAATIASTQEVFVALSDTSLGVYLARYNTSAAAPVVRRHTLDGTAPVVGLLTDTPASVFVFRQSPPSGTGWVDADMTATAPLEIFKYSVGNNSFGLQGYTKIPRAWRFTGSFVASATLFAFGIGGDIHSVPRDLSGVARSVSTCVFVPKPCLAGERGAFPFLRMLPAVTANGKAYFGGDWFGHFLAVDLAFIDSGAPPKPIGPAGSPEGGEARWVVAVVVIVVVLVVAAVVALIGAKRGWWKRVPKMDATLSAPMRPQGDELQ